MLELNKIYNLECREGLKYLPDNSIDCCVTSPPYWNLRDYNLDTVLWPEIEYSIFGFTINISEWTGCLGLEPTPEMFVGHIVLIFREVKRVLKPEGTLWLNFGDSYAANSKNRNIEQAQAKNTLQGRKNEEILIQQNKITSGLKSKDLVGIPWMVAFALRADGWYLRQDIIWHKPNPMPESVADRCTKSHKYIFLLSKSPKYYYNQDAIKEPASNNTHARQARAKNGAKSNPDDKKNGIRPPKCQKIPSGWDTGPGNHNKLLGRYGKIKNNESFNSAMANIVDERNKRSVWTVSPKAFPEAHFATFPQMLIVDCIKAGCPENGTVLDTFMGAGTTAVVARKLNRNFIGFELNKKYIDIANKRLCNEIGLYL